MAAARNQPPRSRARSRLPAPLLAPVTAGSAVPLEQQIYASLRTALMAGQIAAATPLSVRSIAEALGVSNAPVRDALKRLEADGAITARPRSAFYTAPPSVQEYDAILAIRVRLEGMAAAAAAERADGADLAPIRAALARYDLAVSAGDAAAIPQANYAFHFSIYGICGNPILIELIANLWVRLGPLLARVQLPVAASTDDHHARVLTAIERRDAAAAEAAIADDLLDAARLIRATIRGLERRDGQRPQAFGR